VSWRARRMIGSLAAAALLAAGCDSEGASAGSDEADSLADAATINASLSPEEAARLRAQAIAALRAVLPNAETAAYRNIRPGFVGAICGEVGATNSAGQSGPTPFIVTADGTATLSPTPGLALEDPTDTFPSLYARYCASAEELRQISARLEAMRPADVRMGPRAEEEFSLPSDEAPGEPPGEPPGAPREAEQPRRNGDDSFFNSVLRSPRQDEPSG